MDKARVEERMRCYDLVRKEATKMWSDGQVHIMDEYLLRLLGLPEDK
jgi:hypothetical protein